MASMMTSTFTLSTSIHVIIIIIIIINSNVLFGPSYGAYISQLIRYARCCTYYHDFRYCHKRPVNRLLSQGYKVNQLRIFTQILGQVPTVKILSLLIIYRICHLECHLNTIVAVCEVVMHEADNAYLIWSTWLCLSAGPVSHGRLRW